MNRLYIAKWPDGTITIVSADSKKDLFFKLDAEGDPSCAKISQIDFGDSVHIQLSAEIKQAEATTELHWSLGEYADDARTRKVTIK